MRAAPSCAWRSARKALRQSVPQPLQGRRQASAQRACARTQALNQLSNKVKRTTLNRNKQQGLNYIYNAGLWKRRRSFLWSGVFYTKRN
jgi:hypothetical protein